MPDSETIWINGKWPLALPRSSADEWIGNMAHHNNTWEMPRLEALESIIKRLAKETGQKPRVMYIGAYKGDMAALLASWGADMILMESTAAFWELIKQTWELNNLPKPLAMFSGLVSRETKNIELAKWYYDQWPYRTDEYIEGKVGFTHLAESKDDPTFPQISIDMVVHHTGIFPDIVTMDVEGSELEILYGAMDTIQKVRPTWLISVHPEFMFHNHGTYERELHDLLRNNKYMPTWLDYDHEHHWLYEYGGPK